MHPFVDHMNEVRLEPGQVALFWIGQAGYAIRSRDNVVYVDPYLSDSCGAEDRIYPIPAGPSAITNATIVMASHPHTDHYDDETIPPLMDASPDAVLILQERVRELKAPTLSSDALDRTKAIRVGQTLDVRGVKVTAVQAKHDEFVEATGYENLGFILDFDGLTIYHTGDSLYWPAMAEAAKAGLAGRALDLMLVPINGKWGNMTAEQAALLASEMSPTLVIPMHYGTLSNNTVSPSLFTDCVDSKYPRLAYRLMEPNTEFLLSKQS